MDVEVHRLDAARRDDFFRFHAEANTGWCQCVAWWTPTWDEFAKKTAEENRSLRERLFDAGEHDGYLLYAGGEPAGWCQCGPRDRLAKLCADYQLEPSAGTWAVTCFVVAPRLRGRGLARGLLAAALEDLERSGVAHVQAFPFRGDDLPADDVWTGPEPLFRAAGFEVERDHPTHPVLGRRLEE